MDIGFVEVRDAEATSTSAVARAATETGASLVLVYESERPVAFVGLEELDLGDESPIGDHVSCEPSLNEASIQVELVPGDTRDIHVYWESNRAVLFAENEPVVVIAPERLRDADDVRLLLESPTVEMFSADTRLPGPVDPPGDPLVTYRCEQGHHFRQRLSNANRRCPIDQTELVR